MHALSSKNELFFTLEMDHILNHVLSRCHSETGRELLESQPFYFDSFLLKNELTRVSECVELLQFDDPFPLDSFVDLRPAFDKAHVEGAFLDPSVFSQLLHFIRMAGQIDHYFENREDRYPLLHQVVDDLDDLSDLEKAIATVIDKNGEVKDSASSKLKETRRGINRLQAKVRQRLEAVLRGMVQKGHAQEDQLTLREGRLVIPVKESYRSSMKGIVVDQSASGATVFMEPLDVLEMNNEIRRLLSVERVEVERILIALTNQVRDDLPVLKDALDVLSTLDLLMGKARFSIEIDGIPAVIAPDSEIVLQEARHPLLMLKHGGKEGVVPLNLEMKDSLKTLLITGPNAGGKTVALKTVGLCAMMHQFGLHIPAGKKSTLPLFQQIYADIGDQQSIEKDLSTFSSHISKIKTIMDHAGASTLVLLDEIGSATDPEEGSALASAILSELTGRGTLTLATTHMGKLKMFAYETEGIDNASMTFDQGSLTPTYQFQVGIPGASYAFEIAERMGLPKALLNTARSQIGDSKGRLESFILEMEEAVQKAKTLQRENDIEKSRLEGLVHLYEDKVKQLKENERQAKKEAMEESQRILDETNALVENLIREIRESQAAKETVRKKTVGSGGRGIQDGVVLQQILTARAGSRYSLTI